MPTDRFDEDDPSGFGGMSFHEAISRPHGGGYDPDDTERTESETPPYPFDAGHSDAVIAQALAEYEWLTDHPGEQMSERDKLALGITVTPAGDPDSVVFKQESLQKAQAEMLTTLHATYYRRLEECALLDGASLDFDGSAGTAIRKDLALTTRLDKATIARNIHLVDRARQDLPLTWARFVAGEFSQQALSVAVDQSVGLDAEFLPAFDALASVEACDRSAGDLRHFLRTRRERLQADTAVERTRLATEGRHVGIEPMPDGQAALTLVGPAHELVALDQALHAAAIRAIDGDGTRGAGGGQHRSIPATAYDLAVDLLTAGIQTDAVDTGAAFGQRGHLRVPNRKGVAVKVLLTVPVGVAAGVEQADGEPEMAVLTGYGPIDPQTARTLTGLAGSWTRVLTDPVTGGLVDIDPRSRYIPAPLKSWLQARDQSCRCPDCRRTRTDLDHTEPFGNHGPTRPDNLAMLCRPDHSLKHGGYWEATQAPNGDIRWRSAWGTVRFTEPANRAAAPPRATIRGDDPVPF